MDELGWSWPAWKFGMKREDLGTKLHEQYNTFPSAIQDPEAFHYDVFEISSKASTTDEFHRLMAARTQERLQELSNSLESAAFEIIAHPKLVGTEQWQYALQLFRTRSLDSLVRYFSSYLPDHHHHPSASGYQTPPSAASSFAEVSSVATASTKNSSVDDNHLVVVDGHDAVLVASPELLPEDDDGKACFTREPPALDECISFSLDSKIPLSPRSMTAKSEDDAMKTPSTTSEDVACRDFALHTHTTIRTMSFSGSEADSLPPLSKSVSDDDETSQSEEDDSPAASQPDLMDSRSSLDSIGFSGSESGGLRRSHHQKKPDYYNHNDDDDEDIPTAQMPADSFFADDFETVQMPPLEACESTEESETPTPRPDGPVAAATTCYLDSQASFHQHHVACRIRSPHRSVSPKAARHNRRDAAASPSASRRGGAGGLVSGSSSGGVCGVARSPEEVFSRVQKAPLSDPARIRAVLKGRTRAE